MPAQLGNTIILAYGPQGLRQAGDALVLGSSAPSFTRRAGTATRACWGASRSMSVNMRAQHGPILLLDVATLATWQPGAPADSHKSSPWGVATLTDAARAAPWAGPLTELQPVATAPWGIASRSDAARAAPWAGPLTELQPVATAPWGIASRSDTARAAPWAGPLTELQPVATAPWGVAQRADALRWVPWLKYSRQLQPGWGIVTPRPPGPVPQALLYILPERYYMSLHDIRAERVSDSAEIPIYEATISADSGSFAWSFSASGPEQLFSLLAPSGGLPVQIRITVDGLPFVFGVEGLRRTGQFGKQAVTISGRSSTALISAPWARAATRSNASAQTAQQLAADALDLSGIGLDWGITDWLVPACAWSHQGTPLAAVMAIAEAAGGYVQSHRTAATLLVRHPYPTAPWAWGTGAADVEIAPDAIITSSIERRDGPDINAVYVSGTAQGVLALVKRTGTAGDKLAAMVTDPLIAHVDAARQRGMAILGASGPMQGISLDMPVLTGGGEPGVIDVGQLLQINDPTPWRARVRGVTVQAKRLSVRQTITLDRHLEAA